LWFLLLFAKALVTHCKKIKSLFYYQTKESLT